MIGTNAAPAALSTPDTYVAQAHATADDLTDTLGYRQVSHYVAIPVKDALTTLITVLVEWSDDGAALLPQGSESVADGTISVFSAEFVQDVSGLTAPFSFPVVPLPVIAAYSKVSIKANLGTTTTAHVRSARQA